MNDDARDLLEPYKLLFLTAAKVDRMLPPVQRRLVKSFWPDIKPEWLAYGEETTEVTLQANSKQISLYELAIDLSLRIADDADRRLLWGCVFSAIDSRGREKHRGIAWSYVGRKTGLHRHTVQRQFWDILRKVALLDAER